MKLPYLAEPNPATQLYRLNCLLRNLSRSHSYSDALRLFAQIHAAHHLKPDCYTLSTALSACANAYNSAVGAQLQAHSIRSGLNKYSHVANTLLSLYAKAQDIASVKQVFGDIEIPDVYSWTTLLSASTKLGQLGYAREVFDQMPKRDVAVWNAMITGCAENGQDEMVFDMFMEMHSSGVQHDNYSLASTLSLCSSDNLEFGRQVHCLVIKTGFCSMISVVNAVLTMYFNCENAADAYNAFSRAEVRNEITFNVMIDGLVGMGKDDEALMIFRDMQESCLRPTELTFLSLMCLNSFSGVAGQLHTLAIKTGLQVCTSVGNAMIAMYSSCGDLPSAYTVFEQLEQKDLVSWNSILSCYAQGNYSAHAILAFREMCRLGIDPDEYSFGSLLACSDSGQMVDMVHAIVSKNGNILQVQVSNALVSAYSRQGQMNQAFKVFQGISTKNLISWNTLMSGLLLNGSLLQGLDNFYELLKSKLRPNVYSISIALTICASICSLRHGKQIHGYMLRNNFVSEVSLGNALITLYSKCGILAHSLQVFKYMVERDTVSWNAVISAFGQHGKGKEAVSYFEAMRRDSIYKPDQATFTAAMSACSHAGLVEDCLQILDCMVNVYSLMPQEDHLSCMVDLLGRAGYLDEAESIVSSQIFKESSTSMWTLFSACAAHGNLRLGRIVARMLLESQGDDPSVYVLFSNIYAAAGQWDEAARIRELLSTSGNVKQPGCSWIES